jgi:hypothetical protein
MNNREKSKINYGYNKRNYKFASSFVWLSKLVFHIKDITSIENEN